MEMWIAFQYDHKKKKWVLAHPAKIYSRVSHIRSALRIKSSPWEIINELPDLIECEWAHYYDNHVTGVRERYMSPGMKLVFVQISDQVALKLPNPPPAPSSNGHVKIEPLKQRW